MHTPPHFAETDPAILCDFMRKYPFATIVIQTNDGMDAHHIPVLLGNDNVLRGHISKANPVWKNITSPKVLAIFQGPNAYISPSFYPSKHIDGKAVPTWNYSAVHAHGAIKFIHDKEWLLETITKLSDFHEIDFEAPWKISDAPDKYISRLLNAIVGFEIQIENLEAMFKLSQNHNETNRQGVRRALLDQCKDADKLVR